MEDGKGTVMAQGHTLQGWEPQEEQDRKGPEAEEEMETGGRQTDQKAGTHGP